MKRPQAVNENKTAQTKNGSTRLSSISDFKYHSTPPVDLPIWEQTLDRALAATPALRPLAGDLPTPSTIPLDHIDGCWAAFNHWADAAPCHSIPGTVRPMSHFLTNWVRHALGMAPAKRAFQQRVTKEHTEQLEARTVMDVTLPSLAAASFSGGKDLYVALPATDSDGVAITYTVTSSNSSVNAEIITAGTNIRMTVSGTDSNGDAFSGTLTFRLFDDVAPATVARIVQLINQDFYEGLKFHRIIDGFMAQGGDPSGDGTGGTGTKFGDEYDKETTFISQGLLAMANSGDDTNDSQFFITDIDLPLGSMPQHLNFNHTIFGILTSGFDIYQKMITTPVTGQTPNANVIMSNVEVFTDNQHGVLKISAANGFTGSANIQVTADTVNSDSVTQSFFVTAVADTQNDRPYLGPVTNLATQPNTPITFTVTGVDLESDALTFFVKDPNSFANSNSTGSAPANVSISITTTQANGTTPATSTITLTPNNGFTGDIELLIGVRDGTNRGGTSVDSLTNWDTQKITLSVTTDAPTNAPPIANAGGPYTVTEGGSLAVSAAQSSDPDNDSLTYSWDINGDGTFGDATGVSPTLTRAQLSTLGINNGPSSFQVRVRVDDGHGNVVTSAPVTLSYTNLAPTVNVTAPTSGLKGAELSFVITATDQSTGDQTAGFTFEIDWDGDGVVDQTVTGTSPQTVKHTYTKSGVYKVKITATDRDGGKSDVVERTVNIQGVDLTNGTLSIVGSDEDDSIKVIWDRAAERIRLYMNGEDKGAFLVTDKIIISGMGGDDRIYLWSDVRFDAIIDGGAGNDIIKGGKGNDTIRGGDGNDQILGRRGDDILIGGNGSNAIFGGSGNDIIVGGASADELRGNQGRDVIIGGAGGDYIVGGSEGSLMIAGSTDYDTDEAALIAIRNAWTGPGTFEERIELLNETGIGEDEEIVLIEDDTVVDDGEADRMFGVAGRNWFIIFPEDRALDTNHNGYKSEGEGDA